MSTTESQARRATIKDVAQTAGVSVTTVSNVLNGRTKAMSAETLLRVQAAIRALNYRPSRVARSLVTSQTATIGVIVNEISTPLFLQALNVIEPLARNGGHSILLYIAQNPEDESHAVDLLLEKAVDGLIFLSNSFYLAEDFLAGLPASSPPLVLVNRTTEQEGFDQIQFDNLGGIVAAVHWLAQQGHRRIAHLHGRPNRRSFDERQRGYRQGLAESGLDYCPAYVRLADYAGRPDEWAEETRALLALSPRPTAILTTNDVVAATVMRTVQQAGWRTPEEISLVGFDDQPFGAFLNPALTTVQLPVIEAGRRAIELLLARIAGERTGPPERITLPCPLVVRESSGPAPA